MKPEKGNAPLVLRFVRNPDKAGEHAGEPRTHAARTWVVSPLSVKGSQGGAQELSEGWLCLRLLTFVNIAKLNSYFVIAKTARHSPAEPPKATRK